MYKTYTQTLGERRDYDCDEEAENDDGDRSQRFVGESSDMFTSKSLNELKPFYNGKTLDARMAEIRKSIYHIRLHWEEFDTFMSGLKTLLLEQTGIKIKKKRNRTNVENLIAKNRDWLKSEEVGVKEVTYEALKVYTSTEGYKAIYGLCNKIFRQEDSITSPELIRSVVFLVELINIDLYNYCLVNPDHKNFEGIVYRGLTVSEEDIAAFRALRNAPINKRNIAVPLGLLSSTSNIEVAKDFIRNTKKEGSATIPLLYKIHVIGLKDEYVRHYTTSFPSAVLTTICAVDIRKVSSIPKENEILLRGPFLLVLDIYQEENFCDDQPCDVLEAVMLNANRDHISTSFLGDQDGRAREMFGTMVAVTRNEFAADLCQKKGLLDDAEEYKRLLIESQTKLESIMGSK